jgi:hypothetical protein
MSKLKARAVERRAALTRAQHDRRLETVHHAAHSIRHHDTGRSSPDLASDVIGGNYSTASHRSLRRRPVQVPWLLIWPHWLQRVWDHS